MLWFFIAKKDNLAKAPRQSAKEVVKALVDGLWAIILPVFILFGLRSGKFTPTEAGVIAAVYALLIGLFVYKELKINMLMECLVSAAKSSSVIMFLAAAAMVSSWMMTVANVPAIVTGILAPFISHPTLLMLIICLIVLLVGTSRRNPDDYDSDSGSASGSQAGRDRCSVLRSSIYSDDGSRTLNSSGWNRVEHSVQCRKN